MLKYFLLLLFWAAVIVTWIARYFRPKFWDGFSSMWKSFLLARDVTPRYEEGDGAMAGGIIAITSIVLAIVALMLFAGWTFTLI